MFFPRPWESQLCKAGKLFGGGKPIFFDKTGFPPPSPLLSQKNDQRAGRPLDSGKWVGSEGFEFLAHGIGLDVRHGSVERAVFRRLLSVVEVTRLG